MFQKHGVVRSFWRKIKKRGKKKQNKTLLKIIEAVSTESTRSREINLQKSARFIEFNRHIYDYYPWDQLGGLIQEPDSEGLQICMVWFVPDWLNVWGGGHYTLFRFANHFAKKGTRQIIYIYDNRRHDSPNMLQAELESAIPNCKLEVVVDPKNIPFSHAAIATTWQSAYFVKSFPFVGNKFYFMQDFESHFYAHGTMSMQANNTYTFGFHGITGGLWNRAHYESFGGKAEHFIFSTDRQIFFPENPQCKVRRDVQRIFFYGRPSTERRCFELGIAALALIAERFPEIELVIAGLNIENTLPFKVTLLGNLSLSDTGKLYRTCDIGIAFSGTNLSYLPVELMACGVPVISNRGPHVEWYCVDHVNSLLVDPTPTSVLNAVELLIEDMELRQNLAVNGFNKSLERTWVSEMDRIFDYIIEKMGADAFSQSINEGQ